MLQPPCCCFIAGGHGAALELRYCRYCGICISFPQSSAGQPRAVYLPGYKAASQRAQGKGFDTEVGVGGDRMPLCASAALGDVEAFQMQLKGPAGVKRLFVIMPDSSHGLKARRAPATHKLLDLVFIYLTKPTTVADLQEQTPARTFLHAQICRWSVCTCACPCSAFFVCFFFKYHQTPKNVYYKPSKGCQRAHRPAGCAAATAQCAAVVFLFPTT